jgi:hypothetical protein
MADKAKEAKIRVAWITPQPLDGPEQGPTALTGYNQTLERYSDGVKSIAQKNNGVFVDQFHPYLAVLDKARGAEATYNRITAGDAVHPGPPGQSLMAASILKGLNFPRLVSSVEIDAAAGKATAAANCKVTGIVVAKDGGGVRFTREDAALPFFPDDAKSILEWSPILDELNDYRLKVTGLATGRYEIRLGGKKIAERSADELAAGVNLAAEALADGPVSDQVKSVWNAVKAKNQYHHDRIFRGVVLSPANIPDWLDIKLSAAEIEAKRQVAIADRMAKLPEFDAAIRKALEMKPHPVEITPAK